MKCSLAGIATRPLTIRYIITAFAYFLLRWRLGHSSSTSMKVTLLRWSNFLCKYRAAWRCTDLSLDTFFLVGGSLTVNASAVEIPGAIPPFLVMLLTWSFHSTRDCYRWWPRGNLCFYLFWRFTVEFEPCFECFFFLVGDVDVLAFVRYELYFRGVSNC